MAFGMDTLDIDEMLAQVAMMSPGDVQDLMRQQQEQVQEIPDGHLIKYLEACMDESYKHSEERRIKDQTLWKAHESEMAEMADKEDWQSRIVLNKPFATCIHAKSLVKRGLLDKPNYFGFEDVNKMDEVNAMLSQFWEKDLRYWLNTDDAYLPNIVSDSAEMGFATGQSMITKIGWDTDENGVSNLSLNNFPYWHTYPDPDRQPRKPWSGLFNVHEEWVDFYELRDKELQGIYQNIDQVKIGRSGKDGSGFRMRDDEQTGYRSKKTNQRNPYRNAILIQEFWGTLLDEDGDVAMRNCTFTVANGVVIRAVRENPYRRLRWPWLDFSPIPHTINDHGYGIYESSLSVWKFENNLLNLYIDNENWRINNMFELDLSQLHDPNDLEAYPMKFWLKKRGSDKPAVTPILKGESNIADVQFMMGLAQQNWENGTFLNEMAKGEVGSKRDKTATEISLKLQQSMGVFDTIGRDVERGIEQLIWAIKEVLITYHDVFDRPGFNEIFGDDPVYQTLMQAGVLHPEERINALDLDCQVRVRGVSRLFRQSDELNRMKELVGLGATFPPAAQYIKGFPLTRKFAEELNQDDLVMTEQEMLAEQQRQQMMAIQNAIGGALSAVDGGEGESEDAPPNEGAMMS